MSAVRAVTATFTGTTAITYTLTTTVLGAGSITSSPAGISCGTDCSEAYTSGTSVTLTATPSSGSTFSGWSGACAGTGSCVVAMSAARAVTATFVGSTGTRTFTGVRPYGPKAPWNVPVAGLPLHPQSSTYAAYLWSDFAGALPEFNFRKYTFAVYDATKATAMYTITDRNGWGNLNGKTVPYNPTWQPNAGTDAQVIILDSVPGKEWNLWDMIIDTTAKTISIGNGNLCPGDYLTNNWDNSATKCTGSRGVGINYLAMLVRPWEIEQGKIEHALSMPIRGTSGSFYVAPATKLEHPGKVGTIPEGMRFALNVTTQEIDTYVNSLTALTTKRREAVRTILVALKDYGWFITDTSGSSQLHFEAPESAQAEWERIGVLPGQVTNGYEYPRFALWPFLTKDRIITIVPSDQYPQ
jgi:hypothetical protein